MVGIIIVFEEDIKVHENLQDFQEEISKKIGMDINKCNCKYQVIGSDTYRLIENDNNYQECKKIIKNIKISINKRENILPTIVTNSLSSINTNMITLSNLTFDINTKIANLYKRENLYQSKNKSNDTMSIFKNTMPATSTNNFENNANLNNTKSVATLFLPKITFLSTDNVTREKLENHEVIIANFKYEGEFPNDLKLQLKYFSCAEGF